MSPTTTTTVVNAAKKGIGALPNASHLLIPIVVLGGGFLLIIGILTMPKTDRVSSKIGGKVVGIAGRMGSGKTYMAVMIAYSHVLFGHDVRTNFTMDLEEKYYEPRLSRTGVLTGIARKTIEQARKRKQTPSGMPWWHCLPRCSKPWAYFTGWEQFAELDNAVVVIDEAQLYAPSYKPLAFPLIARWKLAMARKFKLDVYWVSQHEDRVNSTLKHLTNIIYVCNAWFGSKYFSAKGYEPEYVRKAKRHIARRGYRFKLDNAKLYDTLEIITPDEHLGDEKVSANLSGIHDIAEGYQGRRSTEFGQCMASTQKGAPCTRRAISEAGLCGQHEKTGQTIEQVLEAGHNAGLDKLYDAPTTEKQRPIKVFRLNPQTDVSSDVVSQACIGLTAGGIRCGRNTDNANGLCDSCIARAKESLKSLRQPADSGNVST